MNKTIGPLALCGEIPIMPSKSASHRAVIMAALCAAPTRLAPLQLSRDISASLACAQALGMTAAYAVEQENAAQQTVAITLSGRGERPDAPALRTLDCGESGSTMRLLMPLALDGRGPVRFTGHERLMGRPPEIGGEALGGVRWTRDARSVTLDGRLRSGTLTLRGDGSGQFAAGMLLALPRLQGDSVIRLETPLYTRANIELTRRIQAEFGVTSLWEDEQTLLVPGGQTYVSPGRFTVDGDWGQAAVFLTAGALSSRGPLHVTGVDATSAQGDRIIVDLLLRMGANICSLPDGRGLSVFPSRLSGIDVDVSYAPDLAPILIVALASAYGESRITGVSRLRAKEAGRLAATCRALQTAGAQIEPMEDGWHVQGGKPLHGALIDGTEDHRVVMAMAVAALLLQEGAGEMEITGAQSVAKSAPRFWEAYNALIYRGREDL